MPKKINKPRANKSKRLRLKTKYSIKNKVKEYNKKIKKEARKMKALGLNHKRTDKEYQIPNLFPFKARVIQELEQKQKEEQELKKQKRQERRKQMEELQQQKDMENYEKSLQVMQSQKQKGEVAEQKIGFKKQLLQVVKQSDVVLKVLDARNPNQGRNIELEQQISEQKKKLIYVLNKVDLVGLANAQQWQLQLNSVYSCVLIRANNNKQGGSADNYNINQIIQGNQLIGYIKKQFKKESLKKKKVNVGVIGFSNSGKQSLIDNLKQFQIGECQQVDRKLEMVGIDQRVNLITVKGTIMTKQSELNRLIGFTIKSKQVVDVQGGVQKIVQTLADSKQLMIMYRIAEFENYKQFLMNICQQQQKLKKVNIQIDMNLYECILI